MHIIDITQELFSSKVFPGDKPPVFERVMQIKNGDIANLTTIEMCVHNGTHIDAPFHFIDNGLTVDELDLSAFIGECSVVSLSRDISVEAFKIIIKKSKPRLLIKGDFIFNLELAETVVKCGITLIGVEGQTVAPIDEPALVHLVLLDGGVAIIEGLELSTVTEGDYMLFSAPLKLGKSDGSPCRAVLIEGWQPV